jgi:hypothetical protein
MNKKIFFIVCFVLITGCTFLLPKYHPGIKWKEISNPQFIVVFPAGYEEEAVYTLETAQTLYDRLAKLWGHSPRIRGKIRILITDAIDESNGLTTFFPYNWIEVYLFTPPPDSTIGNGKDWIRMVLSHELTHTIVFNAGSGFTYFLRKIFGSNPVLYPTIYMSPWVTEGLAIYAESQLNTGGRLNTPDYKIMLKHIAQSGNVPDWRDIWGAPTPWPGPNSSYLYGAAFIGFLAKKYGHHKIPEFVKTFAYYPLPFTFKHGILTTHQRFKKVFNKGIRKLWNEFRQYLADLDVDSVDTTFFTRLTRDGKYKKYPILTGDKKIYYVQQNYKEYPGIYLLDTRTGKQKRIVKKWGINGWSYSQPENKIYFSAANYVRAYYWFSDLYYLDLNTRLVKRLSFGRRLFYPVKGGNRPNEIYCVKRVNNKSYLAVFNLRTGKDRIISGGFDSLAYLAVSPDNRYIAASLKQKNKEWAIALFTREGKLARVLTEGYGKSYYPAWKNAEELLFICQYKNRYRLASLHLNSGIIYVYPHLSMPDLRYFSLSTPGEKLVASFFDANGYNLGLVDLAKIDQETISPRNSNPALPMLNKSFYKIKPYNFLRELTPKYIAPNYRYGGNEFQPGIFLSGQDLSYEHYFSLAAFYGFKSETFNFDFAYTFDGLYPTLSLEYSDLSDYNRSSTEGNFIHNEKKLRLVGLYPLSIRNRSQVYLYSDIHLETVMDTFLNLPREEAGKLKLNGFKLGIFYNSAKRYYDSISRSDGMQVSMSYSREVKSLGSDFGIHTAALEYKQYISLFRPNVLALRAAVTDSWGEARRVFYMGGAESYSGFHTAGTNLFELMRGYPSGFFSGTGGYLINLEYRLSLWKIEKGFLINNSLERLYLTFFADIGNLWLNEKTVSPSYSLGLEINLAVYLGDLKLNLSGGAAVGQNPYHSPIFYLRIGNSF